MKIGILTFHSQQNYGGVLQCWALKETLESLGYEVVVIDRWKSERNLMLKGLLGARHPSAWMKIFLRTAFGCRDGLALLRAWRSIKFVKSLNLTRYHFFDWKDVPKDLGVDLVVVGSDQVWNCAWGTPEDYLFEKYEGHLPRVISYAASFGHPTLPEERTALFNRGLARFSAISCREAEGVEICNGLGFDATHVVDPTLLANPSCWNKLLSSSFITQHLSLNTTKCSLVCYFMSVNVAGILPNLEAFASANDCRVEVMTDSPQLKAFPKSLKQLIANYRSDYPHVKISSGYGPKEFVNAFANATWTLTDSFHAVMFSSIFNKNLRFLKPTSEFRKTMFARIEEFAASCMSGPVFVDSVQSALDSFTNGETISYNREKINNRRAASLDWLKKAIG